MLVLVHANLNIMVILTLVVSQNVYPIRNVLVLELVFEINAKILVLESVA